MLVTSLFPTFIAIDYSPVTKYNVFSNGICGNAVTTAAAWYENFHAFVAFVIVIHFITNSIVFLVPTCEYTKYSDLFSCNV